MAGRDYASQSASANARKNAGGLNSTFSPTTLEDNESSDLLNIDFDKSGAIVKRSGYVQLNTTAVNSGATWNGLTWLERSDGNKYLIGVCGTKIYSTTSLVQAASPFTDRTGAVTITAGNNNHVSFADYLDYAVACNGVDAPIICNGSSNASALVIPTGLTTAKYAVVFQNHLLIANCTVSGTKRPSRIYWYELDSITSVLDTSYRDLNLFDGQEVTGMKVLGGSLVIFKNRSIWICSFTGDSDLPFVFQQTRSPVGCIAGHSIQEIENGLLFLAPDGYYYFDGNNSYKTSYRITKTLQEMASTRLENTVSIYYPTKNRYISSLSLSGSSTHDRNIIWDSFNNAFSLYSGLNANCFARVYNAGVEEIYFGDYAGFVYKMDTGNSDYPSGTQTAINGYYYTKWFDFDDLVSKKAIPQVSIFYNYNNATLTFAYSYDFEDSDSYTQTITTSGGSSLFGTAVFDADTFAGEGGNASTRHLTGRGKVIRLAFKNAVIGETFTINGFGAFANLETNAK